MTKHAVLHIGNEFTDAIKGELDTNDNEYVTCSGREAVSFFAESHGFDESEFPTVDGIICEYPLQDTDSIAVMESLLTAMDVPIVFLLLGPSGPPSIDQRSDDRTVDWVSCRHTISSVADGVATVERLIEENCTKSADFVSRASCDSLVEQNLVGIYELTGDEFTYVNETFADIVGYDRDELIERSPFDLVQSDDHEKLADDIRRLIEGEAETCQAEYAVRRKDGEEIVVEVHGKQLDREPMSVIVGFVLDITAQHRHKREREGLLDRVTDAIVEVDENWEFTLVDERAQQIYGISEEELLGKHFWDVFEWGVGTEFEKEYREVMETREPTVIKGRYEGGNDPSGLEGWFEVHVYPNDDGSMAFYFQDITDRKIRERRSTALNGILNEFLDAETKADICELVVDNAEQTLEFPLLVVALLDDEHSELQPVASTAAAERHLDLTALFDTRDGSCWQAFITGEPCYLDAPVTDTLRESLSVDHLSCMPIGKHGVLVAGSPHPDEQFLQNLTRNMRTTLDQIENTRLLEQRENELEKRNQALNRLNRINTVIRNIDQVLIGATSRSEIEQAVCDELTDVDTYAFAWIGKYEHATQRVIPREWAGEEQGYLEAVSFLVEDESTTGAPVAEVVRTREPQVVENILTDPPVESWREAALNRGFRSHMALPLQYGESLYGVLSVFATDPGVFDSLEQTVLTELNDSIAHGMNALESKQALVSDVVVDLKLRMDVSDHPLFSFLDEDEGRECHLHGIVPAEDGTFRVYISMYGVSIGTVTDMFRRATEVMSFEVVAERDDGQLYEVNISEDSLIFWLLDRGAIPRELSVEDDAGYIQTELSGQADLRSFIEQFQDAFPSGDLIASRERERSLQTRYHFISAVEDRLSQRQKEILETAYYSGYFESPRKRTGSEIAESVGITQPTFSTHIREGLRNVLQLLFEEGDTF